MGTVTVRPAASAKATDDALVNGGAMVGNNLELTKKDGTKIVVSNVKKTDAAANNPGVLNGVFIANGATVPAGLAAYTVVIEAGA